MTSGVKDNAIEVAGRRLNPQVLPEWQLLLTHIEISEGFSFVVLLVPDADWADACRLALSHSLDAVNKSLLTVDFSNPEDYKVQLPGRLLDLKVSDRTGAVWLEKTVSEASPQFPEWQDAWRGMVARLNQFRNPLRRHFKVPLIFVGATWIQQLIRENAPDLWSVRTLVTRIQPEHGSVLLRSEIDGISEEDVEAVGIDPDLALRTAMRLRGKAGKELALAQILFRAGIGLIYRSRWREAESTFRETIDLQQRSNAPTKSVADSLRWLSLALEWQYKFAEAVASIRHAQSLYAISEVVWGEATCLKQLGHIAMRRSDCATGQALYEEALPLYRSVGNMLGEANCIKSLGNIAFERSDYAAAQTRYEEALPLYRRIGDVLGEANCIRSLGNIALQREDSVTAQARYEEALSFFRRIGDVLGEANCIRSLGDIALECSEHTTAQARYDESLPLYRRVGDMLGEGNCIYRLGDVALRQGSLTEARTRYLEALRLFDRISQTYSIGLSYAALARLETDPTLRHEQLKAARKAWTQINRPDLIAELEEELKTSENDNATHG